MHGISWSGRCWRIALTASLLAAVASRQVVPVDVAMRSIATGSQPPGPRSSCPGRPMVWTFTRPNGACWAAPGRVFETAPDSRKNSRLPARASAGRASQAGRSDRCLGPPRAKDTRPRLTGASAPAPMALAAPWPRRAARGAAVDERRGFGGVRSGASATGASQDMASSDAGATGPWPHPNFALSNHVLNTDTVAFVAGHAALADGGSLEAWSLKAGGALERKLWSAAALLDARQPAGGWSPAAARAPAMACHSTLKI